MYYHIIHLTPCKCFFSNSSITIVTNVVPWKKFSFASSPDCNLNLMQVLTPDWLMRHRAEPMSEEQASSATPRPRPHLLSGTPLRLAWPNLHLYFLGHWLSRFNCLTFFFFFFLEPHYEFGLRFQFIQHWSNCIPLTPCVLCLKSNITLLVFLQHINELTILIDILCIFTITMIKLSVINLLNTVTRSWLILLVFHVV